MHTTFLAGGIASGKSTVARMLHERGAWLCDLDQVSRDVLESGGPVLAQIASEFGDDLIDPETGELDRLGLAVRAFASPEATERLEAIEMPAIPRAHVPDSHEHVLRGHRARAHGRGGPAARPRRGPAAPR